MQDNSQARGVNHRHIILFTLKQLQGPGCEWDLALSQFLPGSILGTQFKLTDLMLPVLPTSMFSSFRSLWIIAFLWQYCRAHYKSREAATGRGDTICIAELLCQVVLHLAEKL
jgi:hypothetical protein